MRCSLSFVALATSTLALSLPPFWPFFNVTHVVPRAIPDPPGLNASYLAPPPGENHPRQALHVPPPPPFLNSTHEPRDLPAPPISNGSHPPPPGGNEPRQAVPPPPPFLNSTNEARAIPTPPALNGTTRDTPPPFTPSEVESNLKPRQSSSCENSATSRDCWGDYSIDTNYYVCIPFFSATLSVQYICTLR